MGNSRRSQVIAITSSPKHCTASARGGQCQPTALDPEHQPAGQSGLHLPHEEDEDAGGAIEDARPEVRNLMRETEALKGVEGKNEKDRERPQTVETWDTVHRRYPRGGVVSPDIPGSLPSDYNVAVFAGEA
jgi:hypothetical protein